MVYLAFRDLIDDFMGVGCVSLSGNWLKLLGRLPDIGWRQYRILNLLQQRVKQSQVRFEGHDGQA